MLRKAFLLSFISSCLFPQFFFRFIGHFQDRIQAYFSPIDPPTPKPFLVEKGPRLETSIEAFKFGMLILNSDMLSVCNELIFPRVCLVVFWDPDPTDFCSGKEGSFQLSTGARLLLLCRNSIHQPSTMELLLTCLRGKKRKWRDCMW